jgi:hypothetical protein
MKGSVKILLCLLIALQCACSTGPKRVQKGDFKSKRLPHGNVLIEQNIKAKKEGNRVFEAVEAPKVIGATVSTNVGEIKKTPKSVPLAPAEKDINPEQVKVIAKLVKEYNEQEKLTSPKDIEVLEVQEPTLDTVQEVGKKQPKPDLKSVPNPKGKDPNTKSKK